MSLVPALSPTELRAVCRLIDNIRRWVPVGCFWWTADIDGC